MADDADLLPIIDAGIASLSRGDAGAARRAFETIVASGKAAPQAWLFLAQATFMLDDRPACHAALDEVLAADRANLDALVMRGELFARAGDDRAAVSWFEAAIRAAAPGVDYAPATVQALTHARVALDAASARFAAHLDAALAAAHVDPAATHPRFAEALAISTGTAPPYPQAPTNFFYPRLAAVPFHDPADFPWLTAIAAQWQAIRAEVEGVIAAENGLVPYVEKPRDRPSREHSLLGDARWSAYHLWQAGVPVAAAHAACPVTVAAVASAPIPRTAGRSPMALFSILAGGTHIPPPQRHAQHPADRPYSADRAGRLHLARRQRDADGRGRRAADLRRLDRARGVERQRRTSRDFAVRSLATGTDRGRTDRADGDVQCGRQLWG